MGSAAIAHIGQFKAEIKTVNRKGFIVKDTSYQTFKLNNTQE